MYTGLSKATTAHRGVQRYRALQVAEGGGSGSGPPPDPGEEAAAFSPDPEGLRTSDEPAAGQVSAGFGAAVGGAQSATKRSHQGSARALRRGGSAAAARRPGGHPDRPATRRAHRGERSGGWRRDCGRRLNLRAARPIARAERVLE